MSHRDHSFIGKPLWPFSIMVWLRWGHGYIITSIAGWRYQIETFSALLALCDGYPPVTGGVHSQRPVRRSFFMFSLICARTNRLANNRDAGDSRRRRAHYDVTVMCILCDVNIHPCPAFNGSVHHSRRYGIDGESYTKFNVEVFTYLCPNSPTRSSDM